MALLRKRFGNLQDIMTVLGKNVLKFIKFKRIGEHSETNNILQYNWSRFQLIWTHNDIQ